MISNKWFIRIIDGLIIVNALIYGAFDMEKAHHENINEYLVLYVLDICFLIIFSSEIIMKMITFGVRSFVMY